MQGAGTEAAQRTFRRLASKGAGAGFVLSKIWGRSELFTKVVNALVVNKERALEEVRADYSTTTEIAGALLQKAEVPLRTGHHFASKLTEYGRGKGMKLHEIPFAEVQRIYDGQAKANLPLSEMQFHDVISAEYMIFGQKGLGGPQVVEVKRILLDGSPGVEASAAWQLTQINSLKQSQTARIRLFTTQAT